MAHSFGTGPSQAEPEDVSALRASVPCAALIALIDELETSGPCRDLDARIHAILPEPKVIEPPSYSRSVDAAVAALRSVFPNADWRKFTPVSCSTYGSSPYNAKASIRFDGYGSTDAAQLCSAFLKLWASFAQAIEARRAGTTKIDPVHESAVAKPCAQGGTA